MLLLKQDLINTFRFESPFHTCTKWYELDDMINMLLIYNFLFFWTALLLRLVVKQNNIYATIWFLFNKQLDHQITDDMIGSCINMHEQVLQLAGETIN